MIRVILALALVAGSARPSSAGPAPKTVLVLPIDGDATPALRASLDDQVRALAKSIDGKVTDGKTTFVETATAVGCDPSTPACVDAVLGALAVDELVWGTATTRRGKTTVVVHRASRAPGATTSTSIDATTTVDSDTPVERAGGQLKPLFGLAADPSPTPAGSDPPPFDSHHTLMIAMTAGGGFLLVVGLLLWLNENSVQSDIDNHPTRTVADFQDLTSLESRAQSYALTGDVLVLGGLALAGYGGWNLYKDHEQSVTLHPAPMPGGAGVVLEWRTR